LAYFRWNDGFKTIIRCDENSQFTSEPIATNIDDRKFVGFEAPICPIRLLCSTARCAEVGNETVELGRVPEKKFFAIDNQIS